MTGNDGDGAFGEIMRVELLAVERLLDLSEEELLAELVEDGIDPDADAKRVLELSVNAEARARMSLAKAAVARRKRQVDAGARRSATPPSDVGQARRLTLAARHGMSQSEADVASVADDLARLAEREAEEDGE